MHLADDILLLDNSRVVNRGKWRELKQASEHIMRIDVSKADPDLREENVTEPSVKNSGLEIAEATADLRRSTGDLSLYGKSRLNSAHSPYVH